MIMKKNNFPKISIIILNWNGFEKTIDCLESLKKNIYPNYEVIVVDNGSEGNDVDILKKRYKDYIKLIENKKNLGFAEGNNVAIKHILKKKESSYLVLLNNDTVVTPDFLKEGLKIFQKDSKIGICGPKIKYYNTNKIWWAGSKLYKGREILFKSSFRIGKHIGKRKDDEGQYDEIKSTDYVTGCALFIKREVIKKIGLLDKKFFLYGEDIDWNIKAKLAGYKLIYFPTGVIYHAIPLNDKSNKKISYLFFKSRHYFKGILLNLWRYYSVYEIIFWFINLLFIPWIRMFIRMFNLYKNKKCEIN